MEQLILQEQIAVGKLKEEEIYHYTLVLKAHINLMEAKFLEGTNGGYLDAFTRYCYGK